ncbi:PD-(D/E)XK nuclease family protein [Candidatus Nanosalina sp. VS9-1]|uniref:PD-(D/E)XK nuclease family protein n=1 Tax=Candidatus Nanosalina sp. VS9-1 TaxID=3388566 RepID=UPI0039E0112F
MDRIFSQVEDLKEEGLVLTTDASLADALTSRLDEPVLGEFASTPRRLVQRPDMEQRQETFLRLVNEKDMGWRQAAYLLRNVVECWQHTGDIEAIKKYSGFQTEAVDTVIETLKEASTAFGAMENYTTSEEYSETAVIGLQSFNNLDKKILPDNYREIDLFTGGEHELPPFRIFESKGDIVKSLTENIKNIGPENAAVVVHPDSQYQSMIEASFEAESIPFLTQKGFSEDEDLRNLVSLLRIGLSTRNVRVKDVRPVLDEMDVDISRRKDNRLVSETSGLEEVQEFLNVLEFLDFGEVVRKLREMGGGDMDEVETILEELDLMDREVSQNSLSDLEFFLESFDPATSETTDGVLFADPTSVSFVDRPVVFFIGMGSDWTRDTGDRPWRDREAEAVQNRNNFCSMIQSGEQQVFMVQDRELNREITPCYHLNELLKRDVESFTDLDHEYYRPADDTDTGGFQHMDMGVEAREVKALSQSALNDLVLSPRVYYFGRLTSDIEDDKKEKGNIFHDYAEFYANYPEYVKQLDDEEILQHMIEHMTPFMDEYSLEQLETELLIGIKNISQFLDNHGVEETSFEAYNRGEDENIFSEAFEKEIDAELTEMAFIDTDMAVKGKIDLIMNSTHLVDYKSGRKKSARDIVKASNVEMYEDADWPDFQALMYLTFHRQQMPGKRLKFTFLNFLDNLSDAVDGKDSNGDNAVTIEYIPEEFNEFISSLEMYEHLLREKGKTSDAVKVLNKLGCQEFRDFFDGREMDVQFDKDKAVNSGLAKDFQAFCEQEIGEYKYVRKGCGQIIKAFVDYRCSNFFKEDLDRFEEFVVDKLDELNRYMEDGFPLDANPDDLHNRDMILDE